MAKHKRSKGPVVAMLKAVGAELLRDKNHEVYVLPNGKRFVRFMSPSDHRNEKNEMRSLKKALAG